MANKGMENGFGMDTEKIQKLVDRQKKWELKNERNKIGAKLLKEKVRAAGISISEQEIDAAIAQQG